jgi:hypothetical protein
MWLYPVPIGIWPVRGGGACNRELPRILILRPWVSKDDQARLSFLVNEEHALAKAAR